MQNHSSFVNFVKLSLLVLIVGVSTGGACPSKTTSLVDEVKSLLDRSDAAAIAAAPTKADDLVTQEDTPTNRLLATSAYTRRSTIDLLGLVGDFADLTGNTTVSDFKQIACIVQMSDPTNNLADLRLAVTRLDDIDDTTLALDANKEAEFQLGMLQGVEAFVLPTNRGAQASAGTSASTCAASTFTVTTTTLSDITEDDRVNVQNDFVSSDDHLRASGLANDDEILQALFENYCRLKSASAGAGFTREELRAFVGCELASDSFAALTGVANCTVFSDAAGSPNAATIDACQGSSDLVP